MIQVEPRGRTSLLRSRVRGCGTPVEEMIDGPPEPSRVIVGTRGRWRPLLVRMFRLRAGRGNLRSERHGGCSDQGHGHRKGSDHDGLQITEPSLRHSATDLLSRSPPALPFFPTVGEVRTYLPSSRRVAHETAQICQIPPQRRLCRLPQPAQRPARRRAEDRPLSSARSDEAWSVRNLASWRTPRRWESRVVAA